jgi:hypothetical protein
MNNQLYAIAQQQHAELQRDAEQHRLTRAIQPARRPTTNHRLITRIIARLTPRASTP